MNPLSVGLAAASFVLSLSVWVAYMATVPSGRVPRRPVGSVIVQVAAIVAAVASLVLPDGLHPATIVPAGLGLIAAPLFLFVLSQRKTPLGNLQVKVGDRLPAFRSTTSEGMAFDSAELTGTRTLLKFFRGSW